MNIGKHYDKPVSLDTFSNRKRQTMMTMVILMEKSRSETYKKASFPNLTKLRDYCKLFLKMPNIPHHTCQGPVKCQILVMEIIKQI